MDNRSRRYCTLWEEDFDHFASVANGLLTPDSENYACIAIGRVRRAGAGLTAQAGVTVENSVIEAFRKVEQAEQAASETTSSRPVFS